jgi:hypothetical protein
MVSMDCGKQWLLCICAHLHWNIPDNQWPAACEPMHSLRGHRMHLKQCVRSSYSRMLHDYVHSIPSCVHCVVPSCCCAYSRCELLQCRSQEDLHSLKRDSTYHRMACCARGAGEGWQEQRDFASTRAQGTIKRPIQGLIQTPKEWIVAEVWHQRHGAVLEFSLAGVC